MSDNNDSKNNSDTQQQGFLDRDGSGRLFAEVEHSFLNEHHGSLTLDQIERAIDHNELVTDESILPQADELFRKTPLDRPQQGGWTWSEGWGEKKLEEYCEIVRTATQGHWDEARRKVFLFGRWVGGGACDVDVAWRELEQAARQCDAPQDYPGEIERAFFNGVNDPTGPFIEDASSGVSLDDFRAYLPQHSYIYIPTRELWPLASINARFPSSDKKIKASAWLDQNRSVEQMIWAPGQGMLITDKLMADGGWIAKAGATCFNRYRPPTIEPGDSRRAGPWIDHTHKVFGDDADHCIKWFAQRVQHPEIKINHALVLGTNDQGTGKDTTMEPVKRAVGHWNFLEAKPQDIMGRFNSYLQAVILRVNEARDLGDVNRYQFYDHTKVFTASPPDVLRVEEKYINAYSILNCVGLNHHVELQDQRHLSTGRRSAALCRLE